MFLPFRYGRIKHLTGSSQNILRQLGKNNFFAVQTELRVRLYIGDLLLISYSATQGLGLVYTDDLLLVSYSATQGLGLVYTDDLLLISYSATQGLGLVYRDDLLLISYSTYIAKGSFSEVMFCHIYRASPVV